MLDLKRVWIKVAGEGKVNEKSGNLDMDIEWQPCERSLSFWPPAYLHILFEKSL